MGRVLTKAGLVDVTAHCLQHSNGSHLFVTLRKDALLVASRMGRTDSRATMQHHAQLVDEGVALQQLGDDLSSTFGKTVAAASSAS